MWRAALLSASLCAALTAEGAAVAADTPATAAAGTAAIALTIPNVRSDKGTVLVSVFAAADGFPDQMAKATRNLELKAQTGTMTATVDGLAPGAYAVSLLHDENDNRKMDTTMIGFPKEGYGASNDKIPKASAPRFDDARVTVEAGATLPVAIPLHYR